MSSVARHDSRELNLDVFYPMMTSFGFTTRMYMKRLVGHRRGEITHLTAHNSTKIIFKKNTKYGESFGGGHAGRITLSVKTTGQVKHPKCIQKVN